MRKVTFSATISNSTNGCMQGYIYQHHDVDHWSKKIGRTSNIKPRDCHVVALKYVYIYCVKIETMLSCRQNSILSSVNELPYLCWPVAIVFTASSSGRIWKVIPFPSAKETGAPTLADGKNPSFSIWNCYCTTVLTGIDSHINASSAIILKLHFDPPSSLHTCQRGTSKQQKHWEVSVHNHRYRWSKIQRRTLKIQAHDGILVKKLISWMYLGFIPNRHSSAIYGRTYVPAPVYRPYRATIPYAVRVSGRLLKKHKLIGNLGLQDFFPPLVSTYFLSGYVAKSTVRYRA